VARPNGRCDSHVPHTLFRRDIAHSRTIKTLLQRAAAASDRFADASSCGLVCGFGRRAWACSTRVPPQIAKESLPRIPRVEKRWRDAPDSNDLDHLDVDRIACTGQGDEK
jgi:hypothetical protein